MVKRKSRFWFGILALGVLGVLTFSFNTMGLFSGGGGVLTYLKCPSVSSNEPLVLSVKNVMPSDTVFRFVVTCTELQSPTLVNVLMKQYNTTYYHNWLDHAIAAGGVYTYTTPPLDMNTGSCYYFISHYEGDVVYDDLSDYCRVGEPTLGSTLVTTPTSSVTTATTTTTLNSLLHPQPFDLRGVLGKLSWGLIIVSVGMILGVGKKFGF